MSKRLTEALEVVAEEFERLEQAQKVLCERIRSVQNDLDAYKVEAERDRANLKSDLQGRLNEIKTDVGVLEDSQLGS